MSTQPTYPITRLSGFALAACIFLNISVMGFLQPFVGLYQEACGMSRAQIGLIAGVSSISILLIQPLIAALCDRLDVRRPFMVAAAICTGAAYYGYCHARTLTDFILLTTVGANGVSFVSVNCAVLVGRMVHAPGRSGRAYAGYRVWGSIGYIVVAMAAGLYLAHRHGHLGRESLAGIFALGPLLFAATAIAAIGAPDRKTAIGDGVVRRNWWTPGPPVSRNVRIFLGAYFLYSFAISALYAYLGIYMKSLGEPALWITGTFAAGVVCEAAVMTRIGRLVDRYGRRPALVVAFVSLTIRLLLYLPGKSPLYILAVTLLHGFNFGIMGAVATVFINDIATDSDRGVAQSRLAGVTGLAAGLAPITAGVIVEHVGIPGMLESMAVVSAVAAAIFLTQVQESHPSPATFIDRFPAFLRPVARLLTAPP